MNPANAQVLIETNDGFYALATPPCQHAAVSIVVAHQDFPMPLAVARHVPCEEATDAALGLVVAARSGTLNPN